MSNKTYTLELTAEELENIDWVRGRKFSTPEIACKLYDLQQQARQDRAADELRLPWRVGQCDNHYFVLGPVSPEGNRSERAAKLMSAAPELLEAVQAWMHRYHELDCTSVEWDLAGQKAVKLSERALDKVRTGIPEEK